MKPITGSASVKAVGHDPSTNTLRVEFRSGGVYDYSNFPAEKHGDFMSAESLGRHFHQQIRGKHYYVKIA